MVQLVPSVVAVVQVVPLSNDTCTTSLAPRTALMVPLIVRFALPSLVIKSAAPVSLVMETISTVWVGPETIDSSLVVASLVALPAVSVTVAVTA